jgi:hypothetical protein
MQKENFIGIGLQFSLGIVFLMGIYELAKMPTDAFRDYGILALVFALGIFSRTIVEDIADLLKVKMGGK